MEGMEGGGKGSRGEERKGEGGEEREGEES